MPWKVDPERCPNCHSKMTYDPNVPGLQPLLYKTGETRQVRLTCENGDENDYTVTYEE